VTPTLLGPDGRPAERPDSRPRCPGCGSGPANWTTVKGFGGHWHRQCKCGTVVDRGQGDPAFLDWED